MRHRHAAEIAVTYIVSARRRTETNYDAQT